MIPKFLLMNKQGTNTKMIWTMIIIVEELLLINIKPYHKTIINKIV